ncbi:U3-containing 90S pre-ribosomal complex subunit-domain containing protein [Calycina marina]|uniref:U3-containing 90S pre-ribosomal complex subunit-domain containing protein n=1 Tax=Calycina marina TaxID=1763456 RepID=A0A9P7Z1K8_9HELO|nr:U3-containing 90S pre-ribosomal complex subunit-domain containing protein [Calycina marina]
MASNEDLQEPLLERLSVTSEPAEPSYSKSFSKKRKRGTEPEPGKSAKKEKSKNSTAGYDESELDVENGINRAFAHMDNRLLADYLAQRTRTYEKDLSAIEWEERYLPANAIQDATTWDKPRNLENLPAFLEKFAGNTTKLWSASKKNGSPHTIIVAGAGLRAADLARAVRKYQTNDVMVAKLFAKHMKVKEQVSMLKFKRTGIAVGTPKRLQDLMEDGALAIDRLERIIIDCSHIDVKKRGILEMQDTQIPLMSLLTQNSFRDRYEAEKDTIKLFFY